MSERKGLLSLSNRLNRGSVDSLRRVAALALLLIFAGCSVSPSPPGGSNPINPIGAAHTLYVLSGGPPFQISGFASNASGTSVPIATLTLPSTLTAQAMTTDSTGQIYVAGIASSQDENAAEILVYAAGSTGAAVPVRTILTGQPVADLVGSIAVDEAGQIYVADDLKGTVNVFAAGANGSAAPVRSIQWDASTFRGGANLAVDGTGALYVLGYIEGTAGGLGNPTEVVVYAPGASGAATPVRTLVGTNAEFALNSASIAVDAAGDLYAVVSNTAQPFLNATEVAEFAPGADGNAVPMKVIIGNFGEFGTSPTHLQIDSSGDVYVVGQYVNFDLPQAPIPYPPFIAAFPASAAGTVSPASQFTSTALNDGAYGFAVN